MSATKTDGARRWLADNRIRLAGAKLVSRSGNVTLKMISDVDELFQGIELLLDRIDELEREKRFA